MCHKRVSLYVSCLLATVLFAAVSECLHAKIVYTDIPDTVVSSTNTNLDIDFLGGGTKQFHFQWSLYSGWDNFDIVTNSSNTTMYSPFVSGGLYPTAFNEGQWITSTDGGGYWSLVIDHGTYQTGSWKDEYLHYVGISFNLSGEKHYGWIAAQYNHAANELTVFSYAYETDANTPIPAGAVPEPATLTLLGVGAVALLRRK